VSGCQAEGCDRKVSARGWCFLHYHRWVRTGDPGPAELLRPRVAPPGCSVQDCNGTHAARGLCACHYQRWRKTGSTNPAPPKPSECSLDGCERTYLSKGPADGITSGGVRPGTRARRTWTPRRSPRVCAVSGCDRAHKAKGLCRRHYERSRRTSKRVPTTRMAVVCTVDGCQSPLKAHGLCNKHYLRWRRETSAGV
jgi:hypothetical protein